jgi:hypothetical protein
MYSRSKTIQSMILIEQKVEFEEFWNAYNYKLSKQEGIKAWAKLNEDEKRLAIMAVPKYLNFIRDKNISQALAASWLNKRRWEDDYRKK